MSCEIVTITNQKGGVAKSTTAEALSAGLFLKGFKVLLIDLDPQGSVTLTADADYNKPTIYDLLTGKVDAHVAVQQSTQQVDIITAGQELSHLEMILIETGKEYRLKKKIEPLKKLYDYIIIDTPPTLGLITTNALTASNSLIIPTQADSYSLQGIGQLCNTIEIVKEYTNPNLVIKGILLTRHNNRNILSRDMAEMTEATAEQLNTFLYSSVIREAIAIKEAQASKKSIFAYAPKSNVACDYLSFVNEFIEKGMENN